MQETYRVIEIINETSILVNYGMKHGAKQGDRLRIVEIGEFVRDPHTNKVLGTLDYIKASVEVVNAYDSFSLCKDIKYTSYNIYQSPLAKRTISSVNTLNINKSQATYRKQPKIDIINVGDIVQKIN